MSRARGVFTWPVTWPLYWAGCLACKLCHLLDRGDDYDAPVPLYFRAVYRAYQTAMMWSSDLQGPSDIGPREKVKD